MKTLLRRGEKWKLSGGGRIRYGGEGETKHMTTPYGLTSRWRWASDLERGD